MKTILQSHKKKVLIVCLAILLAVVIVGALKSFDVGPFHKKVAMTVSGTSFNTKGETGKNSGTSASKQTNSGTTDSDEESSSSSKAAPSAQTLFTPTGEFISNHSPNLSGSPAPNTESSVCNTTPGATCQITFTMDSTTRSLPAKTADANGSVFWSWNLQSVGLTAGSWKVQAIASQNGQTKTASDAMLLVVKQ
ncbi:MAG TPA: hypothetical protein VHC21_00935 [Candidatus Saccharimonadales bacterium]|nr:hypothetical protein [Candidatus Saccharimonadales bacterium]